MQRQSSSGSEGTCGESNTRFSGAQNSAFALAQQLPNQERDGDLIFEAGLHLMSSVTVWELQLSGLCNPE